LSETDVVDTEPAPIEVRFDSGQDVLSSYWGYLANGGLVIGNDDEIEVGRPVHLDVVIASAGARYNLLGKMIRRHPDGSKMVVAFEPDQPHDMLLTEALAETENVPPRQHRRYRIDLSGRMGEREIRVVNVSRGGLGMTYAGDLPGVIGQVLVVTCEERTFEGTIQWINAREIGIRFTANSGDQAMELVDYFLDRLRTK
jgi:hypothetical protein